MTASRDPDRLIRAFLDEGTTELPTAAYDAVRSDIERTRQRVVIGPWREPAMPAFARFGVAVAAILIVGIVGLNMSGWNGVGSIGANPTVVPIASPTSTAAAPSASPSTAAYVWPAPIVAGTYTTSLVWDVPFTTTFTVPSGWVARDIEVLKDPNLGVSFTLVDNVYKDPCAQTPVDPPIGPGVSDLVEALKAVDGATITQEQAVSFAGAIGRYLELDLPATPPCGLEDLSLWHEQADKVLPGKAYGGPNEKAHVRHHRLWVLDVGGQRYVIDAARSDDATPADLAEQQSIIDSIRINQP